MSLTAKLRRIALNQQGLLKADSFGRGKAATLRAIERLGYVQIDTISVVERAHHHVLWSRVANYRPRLLERLMAERKIFEYWFHAAAWLPLADYRFALPRMAQAHGDRSWFPDSNPKLLREIRRRIEIDGPLRARDFDGRGHHNQGWWSWKPAKQALEQLFMQGELMVSRRDGFQKVYDLPERVLPDWVDTRHPSIDEYAAYLIETTLRAHGFTSLKAITYLRKGRKLRHAVRDLLQQRLTDRRLVELQFGESEIYIEPELLEARAPCSNAQLRILSPFDNAIIQRERARDVFAFDYQIECYLPAAKRQYGYFCLPLLHRDRFIGRLDCKAHRDARRLEIKSLHLDQAHSAADTLDEALARALADFAAFNACDRVTLPANGADSSLTGLRLPADRHGVEIVDASQC